MFNSNNHGFLNESITNFLNIYIYYEYLIF